MDDDVTHPYHLVLSVCSTEFKFLAFGFMEPYFYKNQMSLYTLIWMYTTYQQSYNSIQSHSLYKTP